ncbi:MAG: hypothetical protein AB1898_05000 [Acidobacteriota bacterium]
MKYGNPVPSSLMLASLRPLTGVLGLLLCAGPAWADQKEKEANPKASKRVYTNDDLLELRKTSRINQAQSTAPVERPVDAGGSKASGLNTYRDAEGHDREYWQRKIRPLRSKLESINAEIRTVKAKETETTAASGVRLTRSGRLRASGETRRSLANRLADLEVKKTEAQKAIQEVEDEARRVGALPEWLR